LEERPGLETIDCNDGFNVSRAQYRYRLTLVLPDGSRHLLRMVGQTDLYGDGYYRYNPVGQGVAICAIAAPAALPGNRRYITTDGTFLQVEVYNAAGCCQQLDWELRFPNGERRVQGGFAPRGPSWLDRGANLLYLTWSGYNPNTQTWTNELHDSNNHRISIGFSPAGDTITTKGVNDTELSWLVTYGVQAGAARDWQCTDPVSQSVICGITLGAPGRFQPLESLPFEL
jgi:hypothetical protein